jgi:hypothetical protein
MDWYADLPRYNGCIAINGSHDTLSETMNDEGHDAFRLIAAQHDTEVDAFAQGSQPYHTSPNTAWYNDLSRYDDRFANNYSRNHRPIETWHNATPMNDEGHDAIVQGIPSSLPKHNSEIEDIRELF